MRLVTGNPNEDFFEQNPLLRNIYEFKELIKNYPDNSRIAWSIYFLEDINEKNPYYRMDRETRIKNIKKDYYDLDVEEHKSLIDAYGRLCLSKEEAMFKIQLDALDRLTAHLKELDVGDDKDHNKMVRVLEKLPKIWDGLEKVKKKMIDAKSKSSLRGGASQSAREKRGQS